MGKLKLNLFSGYTIVFKYIKLAKRPAQESKRLYLLLHSFGNSNSCVQIKSCGNILIQVTLFVSSLESNHSGLGECIPVSHQNCQKANRGGYLNIFRLLWFILTCIEALL